MFKTIKNAIKTPEVRKKLLYTLLLIVVFRFGCYIVVPGVDSFAMAEQMQSSTSSLAGLIDTISGGAFSRLSIFAMSITPYITASIVIQLLGWIIPSLEKMMKEGGEVAKAKINRYTKIVTLVLAVIEALGLYISYSRSYTGVFINPGFFTGAIVVLTLVTGTSILMWLGEQITNKGIGNGISMLIFVGIVSSLPSGLVTLANVILSGGTVSTKGILIALTVLVGAVLLVAGVVFVQQAERRIPVQYAKKVVGRKMYGGQNTHIPLKLAMAGVMPVIFASSFMTFPAMLIQIFAADKIGGSGFLAGLYNFSIATSSSEVAWGYSLANAIVYFLLIVGFTFFYTFATFNPAEVSTNIKQNGGFIPSVRPGKPTTEYLKNVLIKLTCFGAIFLSLIAILPMLLRFTTLNIAFGGTSILIVVGVALETVQQLESQLVVRHYKGFLDK
ncbi:MAG: preprotein translocase subunit SecY [Clostridia bacterium]|nr:preprotein translocase subunit SecY [Clostridia bacterium]